MRRVVTALFASLLIACGSSDSDGPTQPGQTGADIRGTYTLAMVDNKALPAVSGDSTFLSGRMVISDSTWSQVVVVRYAQGGSGTAEGDSLTQGGFWTTTATTVRLLDYGLTEVYSGSIVTNGFTLSTNTSTLLAYSK